MKLFGRIVIGVSALLLLLGVASFVAIHQIGAWNIIFPSSEHETLPPELPVEFGAIHSPSFLVFTKTNSFRHNEGISGGLELFESMAERRQWSMFHTENGAVFNDEQLGRFEAVVFLNTTGDTLNEEQEAAFQRYLEGGGSWVGIHAAGDSSHKDWQWYQETLIGGLFTAHTMGPQFQEARVVVEDSVHPATRDLDAEFVHREEWYSWDRSARAAGFQVLLSVDESTYDARADFLGQVRDLRMKDHPVAWTRCVGRGRALYSALGHEAEAFRQPYYASFLEGALEWATWLEGSGCEV